VSKTAQFILRIVNILFVSGRDKITSKRFGRVNDNRAALNKDIIQILAQLIVLIDKNLAATIFYKLFLENILSLAIKSATHRMKKKMP